MNSFPRHRFDGLWPTGSFQETVDSLNPDLLDGDVPGLAVSSLHTASLGEIGITLRNRLIQQHAETLQCVTLTVVVHEEVTDVHFALRSLLATCLVRIVVVAHLKLTYGDMCGQMIASF